MFNSKKESIVVLVWMVVLLAFTLIKVTIPALTEDLDNNEVAIVADQTAVGDVVMEEAATDPAMNNEVSTEVSTDVVTPTETVLENQDTLTNENTDSSLDDVEEVDDTSDEILALEEIMESCELCLNNVVHGHSN